MTVLIIIAAGVIGSLVGLIGSSLFLKLIFALIGYSIDDGKESLDI